MNLNSNKFEFHQLNDQNLVRVYLTLAEGSNQTGNREGANNRRKGGRKSAEKKRFVRSARLSFEGEIDSRWWRRVPGANPLPLRPFTPSSSHLTDAGHPRAFIYFHAVRMPRVASPAFRRAWSRKGKRTSRERQRVDRGWISRTERIERERKRDGEPRAIHGGLVKSAGETRNP